MEERMEDNTEQKRRFERREKAGEFLQSVSSRLWLLLRLNVMFLVFCIPVVTIPSSVSAMTKVLMNLVRSDDCSLCSNFWREFKGSFLKSLAAGAFLAVLMSAVLFAGYMIYTSSQGFIGSLGLGFILVFGALLYFTSCYAFPIIATVDLSAGQCLKNSFLLAFLEIKRNALLLLPLALASACVLLYPVTLPLLVFIIFALCQYIVCRIVSPAIQKRIIDPYYSKDR